MSQYFNALNIKADLPNQDREDNLYIKKHDGEWFGAITFESMADENGTVTDQLIKRYVNLAKASLITSFLI